MRRSSCLIDPDERERHVIALLESWQIDLTGAIGGEYTVATYGHPRYSAEPDIAVLTTSVSRWDNRKPGLALESWSSWGTPDFATLRPI
jgi:hypothetical protein